jgi:hypothetical protein
MRPTDPHRTLDHSSRRSVPTPASVAGTALAQLLLTVLTQAPQPTKPPAAQR